MPEFYASVASVLEVDTVTPETRFKEVPNWCSLRAFGLLVMMENDFGRPLTIDQLMRVHTVGELAAFLV